MSKISENTEVTLDLKTVIMVVGGVVSLVAMYFALQKEIEVAKDLPEPTITRAEYDLKDQLIRETIMNTKQKVDENSAKLDRIESKLFEIIEKK
jgi:hypothetical protein